MSVKLNQEIQFKKMKTNYGYLDLSKLDEKYKFRVGFSYTSNFTKLDAAEILFYDKLNKLCNMKKMPFYFFSFNMDQPKSIMQFYHQINKYLGDKLSIPMIYDDKSEISNLFDMSKSDIGNVETRIIFILDSKNRLKYISQHDINMGTNPREVYRVMRILEDRENSKLKKFYAANAYPYMSKSKYEPLSDNQLVYGKIYESNISKIKGYFNGQWIGNIISGKTDGFMEEDYNTSDIEYDLLESIEEYETEFIILDNNK